jgi:hypothetical protein
MIKNNTKPRNMKKIAMYGIMLFITMIHYSNSNCQNITSDSNKRWTIEQAQAWSVNKPWIRGSNFNPSTAINQLEFWQAETFQTFKININSYLSYKLKF